MVIDDRVKGVEGKVQDVRGDVQAVGNTLQGVDDRVQGIGNDVKDISSDVRLVRDVDTKLDQVNRSLSLYHLPHGFERLDIFTGNQLRDSLL